MVARDWNGKCLWWSVMQRSGRPKVIEGEAHAILHALTKGRSRGLEEIIVESDCLPVIESLTIGNLLESTYGTFLEESLALSKSFRNCSFSFVKRNGNRLAHLLAAKVDFSCTEDDNLPFEYGE
ncbi:PREDICTED: uncharacterized protein LOC105962131 [Erythranthe guttata]|uniref:uncharacterized protein LOC105962131 n=1 Tax=Erythranthe guttata TaxID=4155 RepID=UPI00064D93BA|nr:PREDICTED: uncharacterized protein LOC105962131 [Erythranthe guttata]|eukprot:XP_012841869.1 PREDICTED: uncharacterized protein LOC105962131 [Erythranthe guttata]